MKHIVIFCVLCALGMQAGTAAEDARYRSTEIIYTTTALILNDPTVDDIGDALSNLEYCTQQGHPEAALLLLDVYEGKRRSLPSDPTKAATLALRISNGELVLDAEHNFSVTARQECMFRCALYAEKGFGTEKSDHQAYEWMLQASNSGYDKARVELARYLLNGKGCRKNPRTALKLLKAQAKIDKTTPNLFFYLGHIYLSGAGLPKRRPDIAFAYFSYGEKLNDANAINNLAAMYEQGIGTDADELMALRLYKKAAQLGCKAASANMQRLSYIQEGYGSGTPESVRIDNAAMQVIEALPLPATTRQKLSAPFKAHAQKVLDNSL